MNAEMKIVPEGAEAKFQCSSKNVSGFVYLRVNALMASADELAEEGRWPAIRRFKRVNHIHPCAKVDCQYVGLVMGE